jgi:hypothetical protein
MAPHFSATLLQAAFDASVLILIFLPGNKVRASPVGFDFFPHREYSRPSVLKISLDYSKSSASVL